MPRLPPSLLRRAHRISPHLATLLPACRDLESARNELRWIREHVLTSSSSSSSSAASFLPSPRPGGSSKEAPVEARIAHLCSQRGRRGIPLQYVLGSQPFGPLDIECRTGILIPRPETEAWVYGVADLIAGSEFPTLSSSSSQETATAKPLRIVDFCTGTGCIALLLSALLQRQQQQHGRLARSRVAYGFDVDERAVALARRNLAANVRRGCLPPQEQLPPSHTLGHRHHDNSAIFFEKADVFSDDWRRFLRRPSSHREGADRLAKGGEANLAEDEEEKIDILLANPPYISTHGFNHDTGRSVRNHEPKLALVPDPTLLRDDRHGSGGGFPPRRRPKDEDVFYARLLEIAGQTRAGVVVFEAGDLAQAVRVVEMALSGTQEGGSWNGGVEIWRDWPDQVPGGDEAEVVEVSGIDVPIKGSGNGRVVVLRRRVDSK